MNARNHKLFYVLVFACFLVPLLSPGVAYAQDLHGHVAADISNWFSLLELPFLILCIFFAFLTANALKGGIFGHGMNLLAWGFLVMAAGHLHMQIEAYTGFSLFNSLLGAMGGSIAWILALIATWGLSGFAFYRIYKASKVVQPVK